MCLNNKYQLNGYTFVITTVRLVDGRYRGRIWVSQRGDNGLVLEPAVFIETPGALKSSAATRIEASAYALELIQSGAIGKILDESMEDTRTLLSTQAAWTQAAWTQAGLPLHSCLGREIVKVQPTSGRS